MAKYFVLLEDGTYFEQTEQKEVQAVKPSLLSVGDYYQEKAVSEEGLKTVIYKVHSLSDYHVGVKEVEEYGA